MKFNIQILISVIIVFQFCTGEISDTVTVNQKSRVFLANQSDHSSVMVKLDELKLFTVTDAEGFFTFNDVSDGFYAIEIT